MINITFKFVAISLTFLALIVLGCNRQEPTSYTGPPAKIRIGIYKGELTSVVYIAEQLGHLKQMGFEVALSEFESGAAALAALNEGRVDMATAADFVFASNIDKHPDLKIIASINSANSINMVARKDRGINKPADLKGKRIAVTLTTPGEYFLGKFLNYNRLKLGDVVIVSMTPTTMEKEIVTGSVDAAIVWNPVARRIKESLGTNAVSWAAQAEGPFHMLLICNESFIKKDSAAMVRLMKALVMAEKSIDSDPGTTRQVIARRVGMPEKYLAEVWGDNQFKVLLGRSLMLTLEEESRWIHRTEGAIGQKPPNYLDYLYMDALKTVRPESVTIIH